jgi:hypothetical protein
MSKFHMRKTSLSRGGDLRKVKPETTEEFLARGGKIMKIPQPWPKDVQGERIRRELLEE